MTIPREDITQRCAVLETTVPREEINDTLYYNDCPTYEEVEATFLNKYGEKILKKIIRYSLGIDNIYDVFGSDLNVHLINVKDQFVNCMVLKRLINQNISEVNTNVI